MTLKKLLRHLLSMRFTAALLGLDALLLIAGTFLGSQTPFAPLMFWSLLLCLALCMSRQVFALLRVKGRISPYRFGVLVFHMGIALVMIGAMINERQGYKRAVWLSETEPIDAIAEGMDVGAERIELEGIEMDYDESGALTRCDILLRAGAQRTTVHASSPGRLTDVKIYYGEQTNAYALAISEGDAREERIAYDGDILTLADGEMELYRFLPYYQPEDNRAFDLLGGSEHVLYLWGEQGTNREQPGIVPVGGTASPREGVSVEFTRRIPYVSLIFKYDPGLPVTGLGGAMLAIGALLFLFRKGNEKK